MSERGRLITPGKVARSQATIRPIVASASAGGILWRWSLFQYWPTMYTAAASQYSWCARSQTWKGAWMVNGTPLMLSELGSGVGVGVGVGSAGTGVVCGACTTTAVLGGPPTAPARRFCQAW